MVIEDVLALMPAWLLAVAVLVTMLMDAMQARHAVACSAASLSLGAAMGSLLLAFPVVPRHVTPLLLVDHFALFAIAVVLLGSLVVAVLSFDYLGANSDRRGGYYAVLLSASLGAVVLVMASHAGSLLLGLGLLSLSLYVLISYTRDEIGSLEAGVKYLLLSAVAAAFVLLGLALLYFGSGDLLFAEMRPLPAGNDSARPLLLAGLALILAGLGFKLAVVPFHMWAPDVYHGSPAPVTVLMATVSKISIVVVLLRTLHSIGAMEDQSVIDALVILAVLSMVAGNLLAMIQDNVKRLLAYSSIAHAGYLLVAVLAGGALGAEAVAFYAVAYLVTMLSVFGVIVAMSRPSVEADQVKDLSGLVWRHPLLGSVWIISVLSLAGIPLTAGFVVKFYVVVAGLASGHWLLVLFFVLNSVAGLFYYLRLIRIVFADQMDAPRSPLRPLALRWGWAERLVLATLVVVILWLGLYPIPLIGLIKEAAAELLPAA